MTVEKQPERMFKKIDLSENEIILQGWNRRAEKKELPLAERVEIVKCEQCGQDRHNIYTVEGLKSFCFSRQCDSHLQVLKSKEDRRSDFYWSFSKVPLSLKSASFENYNHDNKQTKRAYQGANYYAHTVNNENPIRLNIHGSNGTGKSHLAVSVAKTIRERSEQKMSCLFISQQEMLELIQASWNKNHEHDQMYYFELFKEVDLLIIDDFGVGLDNDFTLKTMTTIIEKRSGKPLVITTNLSPNQLEREARFIRVDSKLSEHAHVIELVADDYRKKTVKRIRDIKEVGQARIEDFTMQQKPSNDGLPYDLDNPPF